MVIEKWYKRMRLRLLTMSLPGPDLHCASSWHFGDFCDIFLPNISEGQKKSYHLSTGPRHSAIYGKSGPGYCISFIKRLNEGLW